MGKLKKSTIIFLYLFDALLLLLLLFGNTFLGLYVVASFILLFLSHSNKLSFEKVAAHKEVLLAWILVLVGFGFSVMQTHSVPLSIQSYSYYAFLFVGFIFFLFVKKSFLQLKDLFLHIAFVVFVLALYSLVLFFIPSFGELLPRMNLLYSSYGHNHFGILVVLILPYVLHLFFETRDRKKKILLISFLILLLTNVALGFGRIILLTNIFQILFYVFFVKSKTIKSISSKVFIYLAVIGLLFILLIKNIFSISSIINRNITCPFPQYSDRICKDIKEDHRGEYLANSWRSIQDYPLFGYGPGTYSLLSQKYKLRPDTGSKFAHNFVINTIAEGGLFMFMPVILLVLLLLYKSFLLISNSKNNNLGINKVLLLGLGGVLFNGMFDYDMNFFGISFLVFLLFASLIGQKKVPQKRNKIRLLIVKMFYTSTLLSLLLLSILSLVVELFILKGNINTAFSIFPYFYFHQGVFYRNDDLTDSNKIKLMYIYRNYDDIYKLGNLDSNYVQLTTLNPWAFYDANQFNLLLKEDVNRAYEEMNTLVDLYENAVGRGYKGSAVIDQELARHFARLGNILFEQGKIDKAATAYESAITFHEYVFNDVFPFFVLPLEEDQIVTFFDRITHLDGGLFIKYQKELTPYLRTYINHLILVKDPKKLLNAVRYLSEVDKSAMDLLEFDEMVLTQELANEYIKLGNYEGAVTLVKSIDLMGSYNGKQQLGNLYVYLDEKELAQKAYEACAEYWKAYSGFEHNDCIEGYSTVDTIDNLKFFIISDKIINHY